jgi:hypothetical protein
VDQHREPIVGVEECRCQSDPIYFSHFCLRLSSSGGFTDRCVTMGNIRCVLVDCKLQHNNMDVGRQGCAINMPPAHNSMGMPIHGAHLSCMPGTSGGLALRIGQIVFAFIAFMILVKFPGYHSITCFRYKLQSQDCDPLCYSKFFEILQTITSRPITIVFLHIKFTGRSPVIQHSSCQTG